MKATAVWFWRTLWIAATYFMLGKPALYLADPPGYASPIWPAAGFAVGVVYCYKYGYKACVGITLGSTFLNWTIAPAWAAGAFYVPTLIGLGAAAQAAIARLALIRFVGRSTGLRTLRSGVLFCLIAGPLTCVVNGLWGPFVLRAMGVVPIEEWLSHAVTWWIGDSIGAMIFAPATLALLSRNDEEWQDRADVIIFVACLSLATTLGLFFAGKLDPQHFYTVAVAWLAIVCFIQLGLLRLSAYYLLEPGDG